MYINEIREVELGDWEYIYIKIIFEDNSWDYLTIQRERIYYMFRRKPETDKIYTVCTGKVRFSKDFKSGAHILNKEEFDSLLYNIQYISKDFFKKRNAKQLANINSFEKKVFKIKD